jgi:hypothetical protein
MASYFVASHAQTDGVHAVHDRSRCPPGCFPGECATEYLGEFTEATQAVVVARVRYPRACGCACCEPSSSLALVAPPPELPAALTPLRS